MNCYRCNNAMDRLNDLKYLSFYNDIIPIYTCKCGMYIKCFTDYYLIKFQFGDIELVWYNKLCSVRKNIISKNDGTIQGWKLIKEFNKDEIPFIINEERLKIMLVLS